MKGRSAAVAGRISSEDMPSRLFLLGTKEKPRRWGRGFDWFAAVKRSVALTEQLQQQGEQVDEVQIERQRTEDRGAFRHHTALRGVAVDVVVLQPLGVV